MCDVRASHDDGATSEEAHCRRRLPILEGMRVLGLLLVTGCSFSSPSAGDAGGSGGSDGDTIDHDGSMPPMDGSDGPKMFCAGSSPIDEFCLPTTPSNASTKSGTINTDSDPDCIATTVGGVASCVIAGATYTLDGKSLTATGNKPLVIVAVSKIELKNAALVDVGGHGQASGAAAQGAGSTACVAGAVDAGSSAGGWGGPGSGRGGNGADHQSGSGGIAPTALGAPTSLRGGCPGGRSEADANVAGGAGGVVVLIAPSIQIGGFVNASGGGAKGGSHHGGGGDGGGGGGAGGLIILDAADIGGFAAIVAQGGGGGEGGESSGGGTDGRPGNDGSAIPNGGAGGSNTNADGGSGGNGATGSSINGSNGAAGRNFAAAGGGGGAAGFTLVLGGGSPPGTIAFTPPHD